MEVFQMKKFLIGFLLLFLMSILGIIGYVAFFDVNSYKESIEQSASNAIGFPVRIEGKIELTKSLNPQIVLNDVVIRNKEKGFSSKNLASIKQIKLDVDLAYLSDNILNIAYIDAFGVQLFLEKNEKGESNWVSLQQYGSLTTNNFISNLDPAVINDVRISDIKVVYDNKQENKNYSFDLSKFILTQFVKVSAVLSYEKEIFVLDGSFKNLWDFFKRKKKGFAFSFHTEPYQTKTIISGEFLNIGNLDDFFININSEGNNLKETMQTLEKFGRAPSLKSIPSGSFSFKGVVRFKNDGSSVDGSLKLKDGGADLNFSIFSKNREYGQSGRISAKISNTDFLAAYKLKPFIVDMKMTSLEKGVYDIFDISGTLGETDVNGKLQLTLLNDRLPSLSGSINSEYLSMKDLFGENLRFSILQPQGGNKIFLDALYAFDFFDKINLNLLIYIKNLEVNRFVKDFPSIVSSVLLADGKLKVSFLDGTSIAGGKLVGQVQLERNQDSFDSSIQLVGERLVIDKFSGLQKELKGGVFDLDVDLKAKGKSAHQIVSAANGQILLVAKETDVVNRWILDWVKSIPTNAVGLSKQITTPYSTKASLPINLFIHNLVLNLKVKDGVIYLNRNFALETNLLNLVFDGTIDLNREELQVKMIPLANKGQTKEVVNAIEEFVSIEGNILNPSIGPNGVKIVQTAIAGDPISKLSVLPDQAIEKVLEDSSPCQAALEGVEMRTIDSYLGRVKEESMPQQITKEEKMKKTKKNAPPKVGEKVLNSLSELLMQDVELKTDIQ